MVNIFCIRSSTWKIIQIFTFGNCLLLHKPFLYIFITHIIGSSITIKSFGRRLWYWSPLSKILKLYRGCQFYWRGKLVFREKKPPTCRKSLSNIMEFTSPWEGFKLTTLVVIDTGCIGSCTSNYHTIKPTTASWLVVWNVTSVMTP